MIKKKTIRKRIFVFILAVLILAIIFGATYCVNFISGLVRERAVIGKLKDISSPEWIDVQLIGEDSGGRTGRQLLALKNIVIHYVGNPSTSAQANHDYFDKPSTKVSSHFIVGLEGEIIQCLPLYEQSAASNWRNKDTISIEICHPDESGKFNDKTYESVVKLTAWLCHEFYLDSSDVIRHHDVTGKLCPLYYVEHEDAFEVLREDIGRKINEF